MTWLDIGTAASLATTISVILLLYQIMLNGQRETARFEDELVGEYRDIVNELPLKALLGEKLSDNEHKESLPDFYRYIDLCNEQVFLRQENQVRKKTWENWCEGIESNLSRPAFKRAWSEVKRRSEKKTSKDFSELRELEKIDFDSDPYTWDKDKNKEAKRMWSDTVVYVSAAFWKIIWIAFYILYLLFLPHLYKYKRCKN